MTVPQVAAHGPLIQPVAAARRAMFPNQSRRRLANLTGILGAGLLGTPLLPWLVTVAAAQIPAMPLLYWPSNTPGPSVHATYTQERGEAGRQRAAGLTLGYAAGPFHVSGILARIGSRDGGHPGATAAGANASIRLRHRYSPALSINLQAGVGGATFHETTGRRSQLNLPLGLGIAFLAPTPPGNFEFWAAPRVQLRRTRVTSGTTSSSTNAGAGISAGIEWTSLTGLGVFVGGEWLRIGSAAGRGGVSERGVSFGAIP